MKTVLRIALAALAIAGFTAVETSGQAMPVQAALIEFGGETTRVLVEQMTAISTERLGESAGRLSAHELRAVDEALAVVLGL